MWLRSERGSWCTPIKFFDAAFTVTDDELRFEVNGFRGELPTALVLAARPLERV